jgi:PTS system nitrogen regulatory IIA component
MTITDLVAPEAILPALKVNSKKQALQELAAKAAELTGQNERAIFEVLLQREKLGTTAVGYGVAIPHGKLPKLEKLFGLFARLERPIDFEAMDGQPVDLVFLLLAPEGAGADHLKALARIARFTRCAGDLFGAGPAAGDRSLIALSRRVIIEPYRHSARLFESAIKPARQGLALAGDQ